MSCKSRGCEYERKLVHMLQASGFNALRVAGSGCMRYPSPDILASDGTRLIAFEVKSTQSDKVYLRENCVLGLLEFANGFNAEPWFALHLKGKGWFFKDAKGFTEFRLDENNTVRHF